LCVDLAPIDLGNGAAIELFATWGTGAYTTCVRLDDARVKCWGWLDGVSALGAEMGDDLPAIDLPE
jgi:hypothetical protein